MRRFVRAASIETASAWTDALTIVPPSEWPPRRPEHGERPVEVWRSKSWLVQIYNAPEPSLGRITVRRPSGDPGISWDELQAIKAAVGFASAWAVEVFPDEAEVVNVANMRHLWLVPEPGFAWRRSAPAPGAERTGK